jgi:hypothetical protein
MTNLKINGASLVKEMFLQYEYSIVEDGVVYNNKTFCDAPVHPELKNSFDQLIPHFALILEEIAQDEADAAMENESDLEELKHTYIVDSFKNKGSGFVLSGRKVLRTYDEIKISTPIVEWEENEVLTEKIHNLKSEVELYIEGKQAPIPVQVSMTDVPGFEAEEAI